MYYSEYISAERTGGLDLWEEQTVNVLFLIYRRCGIIHGMGEHSASGCVCPSQTNAASLAFLVGRRGVWKSWKNCIYGDKQLDMNVQNGKGEERKWRSWKDEGHTNCKVGRERDVYGKGRLRYITGWGKDGQRNDSGRSLLQWETQN